MEGDRYGFGRALRHKHLALLAKLATWKGLKFCLSKTTPHFIETSSEAFDSHQNIEPDWTSLGQGQIPLQIALTELDAISSVRVAKISLRLPEISQRLHRASIFNVSCITASLSKLVDQVAQRG